MEAVAKKNHAFIVFNILMSALCYLAIAYAIPRTNFGFLIVLVAVLFVLYMLMTGKGFAENHFKELLLFAFFSRLLFLFAVPSLSDDYFRFVWDGALTSQGINPYLYVPGAIHQIQGVALPDFMMQLKANMNSIPYYSPYPPVLQFFFYVSVKLGGHHLLANIIILRILALMAETGTVFIAVKMLDHFKLSRHRVLLYALNPLVIIELAGNLHGEVFMIFFMMFSVYLLISRRYFLSAMLLGLAVATKLLPLIFIPAIVSFIGIKKGMLYSILTLLTLTVSFLPFFNPVFLQHILESLGYYFQKFEFNASIYYVMRWMGYDLTGFNLIYGIGRILPVCAFLFIMGIAFYKRIQSTEQFFERLLFTLLVYYLFSLIVHPWYITVLVGISVFTRYRFALAWSALVMLTYSTYLQIPYRELLWVTALEYIVLDVLVYLEIFKPPPPPDKRSGPCSGEFFG